MKGKIWLTALEALPDAAAAAGQALAAQRPGVARLLLVVAAALAELRAGGPKP